MPENEELGFSRPDSEYESAQVIGTVSPIPKEAKEEKFQSLSDYMYQGLNQNLPDQEEATAQERSHRIFRPSYLGIAAGVIMVVCLYLFLGNSKITAEYSYIAKDAIEVFSDDSKQKTYVFDSEGNMVAKLDRYMRVRSYSRDHTSALLFDSMISYEAYVNKTMVSDFDSVVPNSSLSEDGKYVLFTRRGGLNKNYLYLYDVAKKQETLIDNREDMNYDMLNVLSGAKMISYVTYNIDNTGSMVMENNLPTFQSYVIREGGVPVLYGEQRIILMISQDGNSIYYIEYAEDNALNLYVERDGRSTLLSKQVSLPIYTNKDLSEIMYLDGGSYYISAKGGKPGRLRTNNITSFITPSNGMNWQRSGIIHYGFDSFRNKMFYDSSSYVRIIEENWTDTYLASASDGRNVLLSHDGSSLLYQSAENDLIQMTDLKGSRQSTVLTDHIQLFRASEDLSRIYFVKYGQLYYRTKNGEEHLISENVSNMALNQKGDTLFFLKDYENNTGTLYYTINGSEPVAVETGEAVKGLKEWNFGVIYQKEVNGADAVFYNTQGTDFTFIMDGVDFLSAVNE